MKIQHTEKDIQEFENRFRANYVNSLSGYKSANLIGTKDGQGQENLCIVSSTVHIGSNPPVLGIVFRPNTVPRHTYENILETGFFTINHVNIDIFQKAHQTSARYPKDISEFDAVELTPEYKRNFFAPFVEESHIKIGLKLVETYDIKINPTHFVIGEIIFVELDSNQLDTEGRINIHELDTVCISGLDQYHKATFLKKVPYAKV